MPDKYAYGEGPPIDCAAHLHVCHAVCCRLHVVLAPQDVDEGVVAWEPDHPFQLRHEDDGWCAHVVRADGGEPAGCSIHERRPLTCRRYDCRQDPRVWADFDSCEPSPHLATLLEGRVGPDGSVRVDLARRGTSPAGDPNLLT